MGLSISVPTCSVAPGASYKVSGTPTDTTTQPEQQLASKTITLTADDPIKIADKTTNTMGSIHQLRQHHLLQAHTTSKATLLVITFTTVDSTIKNSTVSLGITLALLVLP